MAGEVGVVGLAASLVLVVVAIGISLRLELRLERHIVVALLRSLAQLIAVGAALGIVIADDAPVGLAFGWVAAMLVVAAATISRRAPEIPGMFWIALAAEAATAAVGLGVALGLGIFPTEGRAVVPVSGMLLGNSLAACVVASQRLVDEAWSSHGEVEARLALGFTSQAAALPLVRSALRTAVTPQIENVKALGIVVLPGAMTGLILAGVEPLDAVLTQLALMYLILGAVATSATVTLLAGSRRLFSADHRLVRIPARAG